MTYAFDVVNARVTTKRTASHMTAKFCKPTTRPLPLLLEAVFPHAQEQKRSMLLESAAIGSGGMILFGRRWLPSPTATEYTYQPQTTRPPWGTGLLRMLVEKAGTLVEAPGLYF